MESESLILNWFKEALPDVAVGKNLATRRDEAMLGVEELEKKIAQAELIGEPTAGWGELENELYRLIWEIDEQTGPQYRGY